MKEQYSLEYNVYKLYSCWHNCTPLLEYKEFKKSTFVIFDIDSGFVEHKYWQPSMDAQCKI